MENLLKEHGVKFEKLLDFASDQKDMLHEQTNMLHEQTKVTKRTEDMLHEQTKVTKRTEDMLKTAIGNVAEKSENESILRICKLLKPYVKNGISYEYYTIRTSNKSKIGKLQDKKENSLGRMLKICDLYVNSAVDAWNVIKKTTQKKMVILVQMV